jgi:hypothetical protein
MRSMPSTGTRPARSQNTDVFLVPKNEPDRRGDVTRRQDGRGDLIEQRLKQVVVVTVHQGDLHVRARKPAGTRKSGEPGSDDDDVMHISVKSKGKQL